MWEYKITNSDLGYKIYKTDGEVKRYYDVKGGWSKNSSRAKLYFHRDDVMSALVVIRAKGEKIEETSNIIEQKPERQLWSEL